MIERVARAIHEAMDESLPPRLRQPWDELSVPAQGCMFIRARAAILAMREPTEAMVEAAGLEPPSVAEIVWRDMLDAALKTPGEPCEKCAGRGYYHVPVADIPHGPWRPEKVTCPDCKGTGRKPA
jgi:hypothetical protein